MFYKILYAKPKQSPHGFILQPVDFSNYDLSLIKEHIDATLIKGADKRFLFFSNQSFTFFGYTYNSHFLKETFSNFIETDPQARVHWIFVGLAIKTRDFLLIRKKLDFQEFFSRLDYIFEEIYKEASSQMFSSRETFNDFNPVIYFRNWNNQNPIPKVKKSFRNKLFNFDKNIIRVFAQGDNFIEYIFLILVDSDFNRSFCSNFSIEENQEFTDFGQIDQNQLPFLNISSDTIENNYDYLRKTKNFHKIFIEKFPNDFFEDESFVENRVFEGTNISIVGNNSKEEKNEEINSFKDEIVSSVEDRSADSGVGFEVGQAENSVAEANPVSSENLRNENDQSVEADDKNISCKKITVVISISSKVFGFLRIFSFRDISSNVDESQVKTRSISSISIISKLIIENSIIQEKDSMEQFKHIIVDDFSIVFNSENNVNSFEGEQVVRVNPLDFVLNKLKKVFWR